MGRQLALNDYWQHIGGLVFLPGTNRAADRFARASFLIHAIPKGPDPAYLRTVPKHSYEYQAVAGVMSVMRAVSVPLGITTPDHPKIASTIWRTVADQTHRIYYFDSATRPNTFWVSFSEVDFRPGAPVRKLALSDGQIYSGSVAKEFQPSKPFRFLPAPAPGAAGGRKS